MKISCSLRSIRRMLEPGFVPGQIVIQKLTEINEARRRKIAQSRTSPAISRSVLHSGRELAQMRFVVTDKRSTEQARIKRERKRFLRRGQHSSVFLAHPKANVTNDLSAEALFQLSQDVDLGNLLEFVMQRGLEHSHVENPLPQSNRRRMRGDKFADNFAPRFEHFAFVQSLFQPQPLH